MERGYLPMTRMSQNSHENGILHSTSAPDYPPEYKNDYLTPSTPVSTKPPVPPSLPPTFGRSLSQPQQQQEHDRQFSRIDSGIVEDYPRTPGMTNTRSSTIYEYIDPDRLHTEPKPHSNHHGGTSQGESTSSGMSSASTAVFRADSASVLEDRPYPTIRHQVHPAAYDALNRPDAQTYAEMCQCKAPSSAQRQLQYFRCCFIILIIFITFLLAITAYLFFFVIPEMQTHMGIQDDRIKQLESDHKTLAQKQNASHPHLPVMHVNSKTAEDLAESMTYRILDLNDSVRAFGSRLENISSDLQQQIHTISQMPRLQNITGVANLSSCFYFKRTSSMIVPGPSSFTSWLPEINSDEFRDNVVMSVTCGVEGGTLHFVETKLLPSNKMQYRCHCDGYVQGTRYRRCHIHFILCPRLIALNLAGIPP